MEQGVSVWIVDQQSRPIIPKRHSSSLRFRRTK